MSKMEKEPLFSAKNLKYLTGPFSANNPVIVQILGICSALAVTVQLKPAIVMALSVTVVTAFSNLVMSLLRNGVPSRIRIIVQLVVIAALVILVDQVLKLNAALLEHAANGTRAALRGLLILAKGQQQGSFVLPAVRQRILNGLQDACDLVFHIDGAATPNIGVVHVPAKGIVRPVCLGARHHGNHVHVAHEHDRLEGGVDAGKRHEQRMVDELDLARRKHAGRDPALERIRAEFRNQHTAHRHLRIVEAFHARDIERKRLYEFT